MIYPLPHEQPSAMPVMVVPDEATAQMMRRFYGSQIIAAWVCRDAEAFADALAARSEWDVA